MRLLVTGGAVGFIGSHLVRARLEAGDEVRILDDFRAGSTRDLEGIASDVDVPKGSIVDPDAAMRAARDCEVIFHCAAVASLAHSIEDPVGTAAVRFDAGRSCSFLGLHETVRYYREASE